MYLCSWFYWNVVCTRTKRLGTFTFLCDLFQSLLAACFNTFVSENGTLSYPSKDFQSRRFEAVYTCSWTIVTDKTKILEVTFSKFKFSNPPCMQEYLEVNRIRT